MKSMEEAYREDYAAKRKFDDAARALTEVLTDDAAVSRLNRENMIDVKVLAKTFARLSAGVVRTWD